MMWSKKTTSASINAAHAAHARKGKTRASDTDTWDPTTGLGGGLGRRAQEERKEGGGTSHTRATWDA